MSVINTALRDLQQRQPRLQVIDPRDLDAVPLDDGPSHPRRAFLLWLLLPLLAVLALVLYGSRETAPEPVVRVVPPVVASDRTPAPQPAGDATQAAPPGARLSGLQWRETDDGLELAFRLSAPASVYLAAQSGAAYRFVITDASPDIETPVFQDNPWLRRLSMRAEGPDLEVAIETRPEIRVETRDRVLDDGAQMWLLQLRRPAPPAAVAEPEPVARKQGPPVSAVAPSRPPVDPEPAPQPRKPVAVTPSVTTAVTPRMEIRASRPSTTEDPRLQRRRQAHALFRQKDYQGLIRHFEGDPAQDDLLALAWQRLGEHDRAVAAFRRLLERDQGDARQWLGLALSLEQTQRLDEARQAYQRARQRGGLTPRLDAWAAQRLTALGEGD